MNRILKLVGTIFLTVAFCFTFIFNAAEAADSKTSKAEAKKAMNMFRDSLLTTANDNSQIFHQFFFFMLPDFQSELDFKGKITGHSLDIAGDFGLWLTDDKGSITDINVPFYVQQAGDTMTLYYQQENKNWVKNSLPVPVAALTDFIASPTKQEIEKEISMVKDVRILQDNDSRRTLLVRLDGNKLADEFKLNLDKQTSPADKSNPAVEEMTNKIFGYIDTGLRNADVWYTWKIDKKNHKTGTIVVDLSQIIQESALAALNDPKSELPDEFREMLETLAFYSEFKAYTRLLGPEAQTILTIPQEVIDTAVEDKEPSLDKIDNK